MTYFYRRPVIGLALSGGGARGLAHIGVLQVLEREEIPVDCVAGTSMGGVIAAAYAAGMSAMELQAEALRMAEARQLLKLVDRNLPRRGLLAGERVRAYLAEQLGGELTFDDLRLPCAMNAVDLISGAEIELTQGSVLDAIRATTAVPGVFSPLEMNGYRLVDGGVVTNVPVELARKLGAEAVIAVDLTLGSHADAPEQPKPNGHLPVPLPAVATDVWRSEKIMLAALTHSNLRETRPEVVVRPAIPASVTAFVGFTRAEEIVAAGVTAAEAMLPQIHEILRPGSYPGNPNGFDHQSGLA